MHNATIVMLNPQPLPPSPPDPYLSSNSFNHFSWVMLNPQPLPPRVLGTSFGRGF